MGWIYRLALAAIVSTGFLAPAAAQPFPSRPITMVVGLAAGGVTDLTTRVFADTVSTLLNQRVIVENKPGGGGALAATLVQNAPPDGYTLLVLSGAQHAAVPAMQAVSYEQIKGFQPVTTIFALHLYLVVPKDSPANSVKELLELGRKKQGGLLFGAAGVGSPAHLTSERIGRTTGTPVSAVQYRGSAALMPDLVSGRIDFGLVSFAAAQPFYEQGKLKLLAVDADKRWPDLPNVPTLNEAGVVQPRVSDWFGVAAPAGTPMPVVEKLREAFAEAASNTELVKRLRTIGTAPMVSTSNEMGVLMQREADQTGALIRALGLKSQ